VAAGTSSEKELVMFAQLGFKYEPTAIAEAIRLTLISLALAGAIQLDDKVILAIVGAVSAILSLFVRQAVVSQATLEKAGSSQAAVVAKAEENTATEARTRPPTAPPQL
jgi:hypothetical protein